MFDGEISTETRNLDDGSTFVLETRIHRNGGKMVYKTRTFPDGRVATGATNYGPDVSAVRLGESLADLPLKLGGTIPDTGSVAYYSPLAGQTNFHDLPTSQSEQAEMIDVDRGLSVSFLFPHLFLLFC